MTLRQGLLLVDHGSRRERSNAQLAEVAELVRQELAVDVPIAIAHMEIAQPDIAAGVTTLVQQGVEHIVIVPYLLAAGRHAEEDIPRLARQATVAHPGVSVEVAPCLGPDRLLAQLVVRRALGAGLQR